MSERASSVVCKMVVQECPITVLGASFSKNPPCATFQFGKKRPNIKVLIDSFLSFGHGAFGFLNSSECLASSNTSTLYRLSCPPGKANDACSEKYVDGLLHKTGENYEWPIDAQGNTSKGSLGHPEVSCKPECFFPVQCPSLVMDCLESRPLRALQQP